MSKFILASSLMAALFGSVMGLASIMKSVPSTGYYHTPTVIGTANYDSLEAFVDSVRNGSRGEVVGIYVPGIFALPVGQQPKNNAGFVTRNPDEATQFGMAHQYGTVGILAHNDLAGQQFSDIQSKQYAIVVYGDGRLEYYQVGEIQKYQALSPTSTFSDFVNLDGSQELISAGELFTRVYGPGNRLVLQTCIEGESNPSWGRMFIIAEPANSQVLSVVQQTSLLLQFSSFGMAVAP